MMRYFFFVLSLILAVNAQVEDIFRWQLGPGQCYGREGATPVFPGRLAAYENNIYVVSGLEHVVYRIDQDRQCFLYSNFSHLVSPFSFSIGLQIDDGDLYISNGGGPFTTDCPTGCLVLIPEDEDAEIFTEINVGNAGNVYSGLALNRRGYIHVAGEIPGFVVTIDDETGEQLSVYQDNTTLSTNVFWDSPPGSGVTNPAATKANINLFGAPLGANGVAISKNGKTAWTCNLDEQTLSVHDVNDGVFSNSQDVIHFGNYSCEGLFFEKSGQKLYAAGLFSRDGDLDTIRAGDSIFVIDISDYSYERFDVAGVNGGVISGRHYNKLFKKDVIVSTSAFDFFNGWPCGNIALGGDFPCVTGPGFTAGLDPSGYNAAIQLVRL